jgi:hypothetical protein
VSIPEDCIPPAKPKEADDEVKTNNYQAVLDEYTCRSLTAGQIIYDPLDHLGNEHLEHIHQDQRCQSGDENPDSFYRTDYLKTRKIRETTKCGSVLLDFVS